jgi:hypothetical protein
MDKKKHIINLALSGASLKQKSTMLLKQKDEAKNENVTEHEKKELHPDMFKKREN